MGMLDDILKSALGSSTSSSGGEATSLVQGLLELFDDPQTGGLDGLTQSFQSQGLGEVIASWIGTGANRTISSDQLASVLGSSRMNALAQRVGLSPSQAPALLAAVLPALIDKLTPDGRVPQRAELSARGSRLVGDIGAAFGSPGQAFAQPVRPPADFSDVQSSSSSTAPPSKPAEETYVVAAGDSLSKIAKRLYGDANQWRRIFEANRDQIQNPDLIHPGQKLRIPRS